VVKIGSLFVLKKPVYLYQDRPMFPWDKLPEGTKGVAIGHGEGSTDQVEVLVDDGRRGWVADFQLEDSIVEVSDETR
jgi:hypothetical protein